MGCSHSMNRTEDLVPILYYPSVVHEEIDQDIVKVWEKFLRGECASWYVLVASGCTKNRPPAVYWADEFKNGIVKNIALVHPLIALELQLRPLKVTAKVLCQIMEMCLTNIIMSNATRTPQEIERQQTMRHIIAQKHCKWQVEDASYITVENAMIDALRTCLGGEFIPLYEVRLRYKFGCMKQSIQDMQTQFETEHPTQATELRNEAETRMGELRSELKKKQEEQAAQEEKVEESVPLLEYSTRESISYQPMKPDNYHKEQALPRFSRSKTR